MCSLPFFNLNDSDFNQFINADSANIDNNVLRISIDQLRSMKLNMIDYISDKFTVDDDLDLLDIELNSKILQNSDYYFDNFPGLETDSFSIYCHNINSLSKHYDELMLLLETELKSKFDVIALCECKITDDIANLYNMPGYSMFTNNTTRKSGGLALYINSSYDKSFVRNDLSINCIDTEALFVEIPCKQKM